MPLLTGFEVLKALPLSYYPSIIIVTAHDNFALTAYEHDAIDYLLKPFSTQRFDKAFQKSLQSLEQKHLLEKVKNLESLEQRLQSLLGNNQRQNITVKDGSKNVCDPDRRHPIYRS